MATDVQGPDAARAAAVLLHPHPHYGGTRFHPLVDRLFHALPEAGVGAVRFDFTSPDATAARDEALAAVGAASDRWPGRPVLLVGYSFGAGVAAGIADPAVAGWFLVAPQTAPLGASPLGADPRPTAIVVPDHDQFAPPDAVATATDGWTATTRQTVPGDHFLAASVGAVVDACLAWAAAVVPA
jgi:alpha/beta superfamily hydrolase